MVPLLLLLPLLWGGSLTVRRDYELELEVQESVTVQEGLCVHVPCSFYPWNSWYPSSKLYTYWYRRRDTINWDVVVATNNPSEQLDGDTQRRFLLADPRTNNCSLSIRDARKSDAGTYFFRVERYNAVYDYQDKMLTLRVTEFTQKPDILIAEALESGRPTQLTCSLPGSCKGGTPLTFSWAGAALDSLNSRNLRSSVLTFTPRPRDHGTNLTCQVKPQWRLVTTQRTILLNVFYAPRKLTIDGSYRNVTALKILQSTSSLPILEGEALRLLCVADSNPPAQLSWFRGSPALNATPISSTAILELPRMGTGEEGEFTCQARHPLGSQNLSFSLAVVYPPRLLGPSCSWEDEDLNCSCSSRAQPAPSLRWRLGEGLLEGNHSNASYTVTSSSAGPWANSSLSLRVGLAGLTLSCEAENVHGAQSASVLLLLPGQSASASREVPVALAGAGAMALLSLCLCLISFCMVKFCRKQAGRRRRVMNDEDPVMGTVPWGSQQKSQPARPPDQASPTRDIPPSGEQQELHYANISFHGLKPREPQDQEATRTSEYSEIKMTSK